MGDTNGHNSVLLIGGSDAGKSNFLFRLAEMWAQILRRARSDTERPRTTLTLCAQALKFAFDNTRLPLGCVVSEAFREVYVAVTESSRLPPETECLFGVFDWDKGKELRRDLVDSFFYSHWQPGELALAAGDVRLLRKIFKRLLKNGGGERYARTVLSDLKERGDERAIRLSKSLQEMLEHPDFYEEWD